MTALTRVETHNPTIYTETEVVEYPTYEEEKGLTQSPLLCRGVFGIVSHQWLLLSPTDEQLKEVRELISFGRDGSIGARAEDVFDRICPKCFAHECRIPKYIEALRRARGVE